MTFVNGLTVNGTVNLGNAAGTTLSVLRFSGTQTLGGTGSILFGNDSDDANQIDAKPGVAGTTLTIGPDLLIHGKFGHIGSGGAGTDGAASIVNQGTIRADVAGGTISIDPQNPFTNDITGRAQAERGATLIVGYSASTHYFTPWTNLGTLEINPTYPGSPSPDAGSTLILGGTFATDSVNGKIVRISGQLELDGILDNTGKTLSLDADTGSLELDSGTIVGGVVDASGDYQLLESASNTGALDGVTLDADFVVDGRKVVITDGLTVNGTVTLQNNSSLHFQTTANQTLAGTGVIVLGHGSNNGFIDNASM